MSPMKGTRGMRPKRSISNPAAEKRFSAFKKKVSINQFYKDVIRLVNLERTSRGIPALRESILLDWMAYYKAIDMRDKGYFGHVSPVYGNMGQQYTRFGIRWTAYGENLAYGYTTPQAVVAGWMNSAGHRANILNPNFTYTGVWYTTGGTLGRYWVQVFWRG
ncbi:CAP domain-containing protein [Paenibacillus spongiae]|uniref:CAP domain-containing protein n=1 Tax=Paenibacillus spongiae TaxID=2909671 RepID=A0ABY5S3J0_9BACL|nr:CAP domain-containing protein [Paenibacillus spongiae]UVI27288.1 CAP domain-containing protein [Paenibacillus spongiae]